MQAIPIVSTLFSAAGSFQQASLAKAQGKAENQQAQMAAEDYRIRAAEEDTSRLNDFYSTISTIQADLAGRGVGKDLATSETGAAIDNALLKQSTTDRQNTQGSYQRKVSQTLFQGRLAEFGARAQALGYQTQGVKSLFSAAQDSYDWAFGDKKKG